MSSPEQLAALPDWARDFVHVGVTGTNGKTTTTHFVAAALGTLARPVASFSTVGAFIDEQSVHDRPTWEQLLATLDATRGRGGRYAVFETTSRMLASGFAGRIPFRAAVFTNLTRDHLDAHGSAEHYFASKAQLFRALPGAQGTAVVNGCDEVADLLVEVTPPGVRHLAYGVASRGAACLALDASARDVTVSLDGTRATIALGAALGGGAVELETRAVGEPFLENALAALVLGLALGAEREPLVAAIARAAPPPGRFEIVAQEPLVVVDYAHTPDALLRTLATARRLTPGRLHVVFGAAGERDPGKRAEMGAAAAAADRVTLTTDDPRSEEPAHIANMIREGVPPSVEVAIELDRERAIVGAILAAASTDTVLVAGKGHERVLIVGSEARAFSDVAVARRAVAERVSG